MQTWSEGQEKRKTTRPLSRGSVSSDKAGCHLLINAQPSIWEGTIHTLQHWNTMGEAGPDLDASLNCCSCYTHEAAAEGSPDASWPGEVGWTSKCRWQFKKKPNCFTKRNQSDAALSNLLLLLQTPQTLEFWVTIHLCGKIKQGKAVKLSKKNVIRRQSGRTLGALV